MSGTTGMKKYTDEFKKEIIHAFEKEGLSYREIAEKYNFNNRDKVKQLLKRERRKEQVILTIPKKRGRPRKNTITGTKEIKKELHRLQMENELLRNFLHLIGRR